MDDVVPQAETQGPTPTPDDAVPPPGAPESGTLPTSGTPNTPSSPLTRRSVVQGAAAVAGIATVATFWFDGFGDPMRRRSLEPTPPSAPPQYFTPESLATCAAVMDRLLPSEGAASPGARDVNAAGYLDALFARGDMVASVVKRVGEGLQNCDRLARQRFRRRRFRELTATQQDAVLRSMQESKQGVLFLRNTTEMVLECFFGDPVHGGNPNEIGWKWANHIPGTPRPTAPHWRPKEQA